MMLCGQNELVEFGPFRLDIRNRKLSCDDEEVRCGGRAIDILTTLASSKGEIVAKEHLFRAAWPNIFVHESNLKVTIAAIRRALRQYSPSFEYIVTVVGRGYFLRTEAPPEENRANRDRPAAGDKPLPELGTVIGRDSVIAQLHEMLASNRLTTIAGAGGIGKTTVAVSVAQLFEDEGGGSVAFVDLARIASEEFVVPSLAAALGISSAGRDGLRAIVSILARRKTLIVFDTCEHVLSAVAHVCDVVLASTPDVRILATSRQVLRAREEKVVWLAPLDVPPPDRAETAQEILCYSAPQLLAARALEMSGYRLNDADVRPIAEICRRLDGAPLALELVSSRLSDRSAGAVLEELDDRFRTLARNGEGGPSRQKTLLATLEWSYALLTKDEADTLRAISIFAGSFDTDAVVRLVAHGGLTPAEAFDAVSGLRAKSMLSVDYSSGELQYRLLDSTRAFASELLRARGDQPAISARHARLLRDILASAGREYVVLAARQWHARYAGLVDDLRKALEWALHRSNDILLGIQLTAAALPLWHELSLEQESHGNCKRSLAELGKNGVDDDRLKLAIITGLATTNTYLAADEAETIALFEAGIRLARGLDDARAECRLIGALITYFLLPGERTNLSETFEAMRDAAQRTNDRGAVWEHEQLRAHWEVLRCEFQSGHARLTRLLSEMTAQEGTGPQFQIHQRTNVEVQFGALCWLMGKPGQALENLDRAVKAAKDMGRGLTLIHSLCRGIIWVALLCGRIEQAAEYSDHLRKLLYQYGLALWLPLSELYSQAVECSLGRRITLENLRATFDSLRYGPIQLRQAAYLQTLAEAMISIGEFKEAARVIDHFFDVGAIRWILPEMLRLRAATERAFGRDDDAVTSLREALYVADESRLFSWKLRSALDLAMILNDRGSGEEARQILASAYAHFTDGYCTGDLRKARALLQQWR